MAALPRVFSCELLKFSQLPLQYDLNDFASRSRIRSTPVLAYRGDASRQSAFAYPQTDATVFLHPISIACADKTGFRRPSCGGKRSVCCATSPERRSVKSLKSVVSPRRFALKAKRGWVILFIPLYVQSRPAYRFCSSPYGGDFVSARISSRTVFTALDVFRTRTSAVSTTCSAARRLTCSCRVAFKGSHQIVR